MFKSKKYVFSCIIVFIVVSIFYWMKFNYKPFEKFYSVSQSHLGENLSHYYGEIVNGIELDQEFIATKDGLSGIDLFLSTFNRQNTGQTTIEVLDSEMRSIRKETFNNSQVEDNKIRSIYFNPINGSKGEKYVIRITSENTSMNNAITIWIDNTKKGVSYIDSGKKKEGLIVATLKFKDTFSIYRYLFTTVFLVGIYSLVYYVLYNLKK